jgi:hypothetical protein
LTGREKEEWANNQAFFQDTARIAQAVPAQTIQKGKRAQKNRKKPNQA